MWNSSSSWSEHDRVVQMSLNITSSDGRKAKDHREIYRSGVAGNRCPGDKEPRGPCTVETGRNLVTYRILICNSY